MVFDAYRYKSKKIFMITIACVATGTAFNETYINNLKAMVARHCPVEYDFVVIDDNAVDNPTHSWWDKIELFKPGRFDNRVLYLDLDVVIDNPLTDILAYTDDFVIIDNFVPG